MHRLSRHPVYGCRGMICSNSPLAASAGIKVLQDGGNAFDAALAVAATETVTIVSACGLGGDAFVLLYEGISLARRCIVAGVSPAASLTTASWLPAYLSSAKTSTR